MAEPPPKGNWTSAVLDASVIIAHLKGPEREPEEHVDAAGQVLAAFDAGLVEIYLPSIAIAEIIYWEDEGADAEAPSPANIELLDDYLEQFNYITVDRPLARRARQLVRETQARNGIDAIYVAAGIVADVDRVFTFNTKDLPPGIYQSVTVDTPYPPAEQGVLVPHGPG
jgi:predicted nucleic acid-binding protein